MWKDEFISWDSDQFCGISRLILPTKHLWKPDLTIEEMTEKDKASQSPYLSVDSDGTILLRNDMMVSSTCKMRVYKFPFDIQSCHLSFKSIIHDAEQMNFVQMSNSASNTEWSRAMMRSQSEWRFINMEIFSKTANNFGIDQNELVCQINMKRRPILYVVNFMLPIMLFFGLDLASFLISDNGGEKLSFKVTVMLAVTVMQLILNEILPSSSDRIPLIAVYCIGIFGLMMLSLLETILVMYLIERDNESTSLFEDCKGKCSKVSFQNCFRDVKTCVPGACVRDVPHGETSSELLAATKEGSSSQQMEESHDFEKVSDELREVVKTLTLLLSSKTEEGKPGYWTRITKTIDRVFLVFYVIAATLFLIYMYSCWTEEGN
uniref:5-hydroxytryptamine receptor 3A-like n=1 Tax=Scatophagus argus TaxID=75038 RepID=UPI001ED7F71A|nr:5-hydroxytryptamine receptor 3A-like [Scatophagus argus]